MARIRKSKGRWRRKKKSIKKAVKELPSLEVGAIPMLIYALLRFHLKRSIHFKGETELLDKVGQSFTNMRKTIGDKQVCELQQMAMQNIAYASKHGTLADEIDLGVAVREFERPAPPPEKVKPKPKFDF